MEKKERRIAATSFKPAQMHYPGSSCLDPWLYTSVDVHWVLYSILTSFCGHSAIVNHDLL